MTGYVRKDTTNNIADGNVINAADLDAEFDGVQDAFNASTGHKHDGTAGEGATINALGPTQDVTISSTLLAPKTTNTVDIGSSSLKFKDLFLAGNGSVGGTLAVTGVATFTAQPILSSLTASRAVFSDGSKGLVSNAITGTGNVVMSASPTLTGTAGFENITASGTLGVTGVATFTAQPIVSSLTASRAVFSDGSKGLVSNAITGTGNVVMSASPTLTGTIAAEALTASSSVTLSGGTANGVAYLNGSKVLTSGSALYFDGTNLGVGTTSPTSYVGKIVVNGHQSIIGGNALFLWDSGNANAPSIYAPSDSIAFKNNAGSELMRLTSTGLGIGTSSPATQLDVASNTGTEIVTRRNGGRTVNTYADAVNAILAYSTGALRIGETTSTVGANFTERMRLDSAGNLGLGVTPSAWYTSYGTKVFQFAASGVLYGLDVANSDRRVILQNNAYVNASGNEIYLNTGAATKFLQRAGAHSWHTAPSGTAGDAISFTQAMTLDASGNLGVGTTSPSSYGKLAVVGTGNYPVYVSNTGTGAALMNFVNNTTNSLFVGVDSSSGSALSGTAYAAAFWYQANYPMVFATNNTERARIDSSGNLLVGTTTSSAARLQVVAGTSVNGVEFTNGSADWQTITAWNQQSSGNNIFVSFFTDSSITFRGGITFNRAAGLTSYNTTSDYRAKDISGPVTNSGALIDSVPVYIGKMKGATQERPMFIAHETPEYAHTGVKDAVDADGNPVYQQMDASALIPVMWAEIQSLRQRVAQLETN